MKVRPGTHRGEHAPQGGVSGAWIAGIFVGKFMEIAGKIDENCEEMTLGKGVAKLL